MEPSIIDYYNEIPNVVNVIDKMNDELAILQHKYDLLKKTYEPEKSIDNFLRCACRSDDGMAKLLYKLYGDHIVCTSIKNNEWYFYDIEMKKWRLSDEGIELRIKLGGEIHNIYMKKADNYIKNRNYLKDDDDLVIHWGEAYIETGINLKNPRYKQKIMKECKWVFYNKDFFKNNNDIEDLSEYYTHDHYTLFPKLK